jgi:Family of unknown function (DUF5985)
MLSVITSLLCAWLLARAYRRGRTRLLVWSALCFAFLAVNNLVLAVDVLLCRTSISAYCSFSPRWPRSLFCYTRSFGNCRERPVCEHMPGGMVTTGFLTAGL